jgi:hypothetical protein
MDGLVSLMSIGDQSGHQINIVLTAEEFAREPLLGYRGAVIGVRRGAYPERTLLT